MLEVIIEKLKKEITRQDLLGFYMLARVLTDMKEYEDKYGILDHKEFTLKRVSERLNIKYDVLSRNLTTLMNKDTNIIANTPKQMIFYYYYRI